jgi:hypothetical protein
LGRFQGFCWIVFQVKFRLISMISLFCSTFSGRFCTLTLTVFREPHSTRAEMDATQHRRDTRALQCADQWRKSIFPKPQKRALFLVRSFKSPSFGSTHICRRLGHAAVSSTFIVRSAGYICRASSTQGVGFLIDWPRYGTGAVCCRPKTGAVST